MTPNDFMTAYRAELSRLYGSRIADATVLFYRHGWFYLSQAYRALHNKPSCAVTYCASGDSAQ
jgi:hypothetical protein